MITFGSLFSGIGGIDLGFERAGLTCSWQVEIDSFCRKILAKHWPTVRRHDDIRTFQPTQQEYQVDVICGGFPCKQTSTAAAVHGCRKGLAGADSGLWYEMLRVVRLVRPRIVVVENVAGARTWQKEIVEGLADAGYRVPAQPLCLSAADVGAPHQRRRLFWIANLTQPRLEGTLQKRSPHVETLTRETSERNPWLQPVSGSLRVAHGLPCGVDRRRRIIALGNAVVPAMAEVVGRAVVAMEAELRAEGLLA